MRISFQFSGGCANSVSGVILSIRGDTTLFDLRPKEKRSKLFDREEELSKILKTLNYPLPIITILGIRRIGKTSLLKTCLNELENPYLYIDARKFEIEGYSNKILLQNFHRIFNQRNFKMEEIARLH
ncbi:MAG TPA: AAA family ATPase [Geobacterales bacterium]|nr:AAA family ATPase [Geobacterales bacterium]